MAKPTDEALDSSVASMLRFGVTLAALIVLAGGILLLRKAGAGIANYSHFEPADPDLCNISGISRGAMHFEPMGLIQFGILVLIGTPIARVFLCVVGFSRQRKLFYIAVSLLVLTILIYSFARTHW